VNGILIGGTLYTKKALQAIKKSFNNYAKGGRIDIREYLNLRYSTKELKHSLDKIIMASGIGREKMLNFEEFLKFMLPGASKR
jgi:hypothetical protein